YLSQSDCLDLVGELLAFRLIRRAHPLCCELVELRDVGPAEPGVLAGTQHPEMNCGIDQIRRLPPRVKQVPAAAAGRAFPAAHDEARRPVHRPEVDVEADTL